MSQTKETPNMADAGLPVADVEDAIARVRRLQAVRVVVFGDVGSGKTAYLRELKETERALFGRWERGAWAEQFVRYLAHQDSQFQKTTDRNEMRWAELPVTEFFLREPSSDPIDARFRMQLTTFDLAGEMLSWVVNEAKAAQQANEEEKRFVAQIRRSFASSSAALWFIPCPRPGEESNLNSDDGFQMLQRLPKDPLTGRVMVPVVVVLTCADRLMNQSIDPHSMNVRQVLMEAVAGNPDLNAISEAGRAFIETFQKSIDRRLRNDCSDYCVVPVSAWGREGIWEGPELGMRRPEPTEPMGLEVPLVKVCERGLERFRERVLREVAVIQVERLEAERERQRAAEVAKERERQKQLDEAAALRRRHNERLHVRQKLTLKAVFALTAVTGFALGWTYL